MAYDSPLSEYSIIGYEYGYSLVHPDAIVIWEAQFGDFVNGGQVIIDNYIASAESKWGRMSGLVLLLPHGYEGQGPDHSSGHIERFLQLAADNNMQICNATTPAQYFHLLRKQVKANYRKPLVIMTPKSLLRHPRVVSTINEFDNGGFQEILDEDIEPNNIERVLLCSGKIYYDLLEKRETLKDSNCALIRIEQLYPFPNKSLRECFNKYSQVRDVVWIQEEAKNCGAWSYILNQFKTFFPEIKLLYMGRDEKASSASGSFKQHKKEQEALIEDAFK
jgi:2-oxoglutarate dehydrogenase E1 component